MVIKVNERFLDLYQQIELAIRENYPEIIFPGQNVVASLATLEQFKSREDMIYALRNIRNTLSHAKKINGQDIITVNECLIQFSENLLNELKQPQLVEYDKKYKCISITDTIESLSKLIKSKRYAPVVDDKKQVIGIVTPYEFFDILCSKKYATDAKLSDFKKHLTLDGYVFVKTDITQKEVLAIIEENQMIGKRIKGLILTDNGSKTGKFISFVKII